MRAGLAQQNSCCTTHLSGCNWSACSSTLTVSCTLQASKNSLSTHSLHKARAAHMVVSTCIASSNGRSSGTTPLRNRNMRFSAYAAKLRKQTHALQECYQRVKLHTKFHLQRMSRITIAATDVGSEGKCLIRQHLRASGMPFAVSSCKMVLPPPPEMFLIEPIVYLPSNVNN